MSKSKKNLLIFFIFIFTSFWVVYYLNQDFFKLSYLFDNLNILQEFISKNFLLTLITFSLVYCLLIILNFPLASMLSMIGGFLFGTLYGGIAIIFGGSLGAFIFFLIAKFFFLDFVKNNFLSKYKSIAYHFNKNDVELMLLIRLIPAVPFFAQNLILAGLGATNFKFVITTFIGLAPWAFIFASIGQGLNEIFINNIKISFSLFAQPEYLIPIVIMFIIVILIFIFKKNFRK